MNKNALRRATALTVSTVMLASLAITTMAAPAAARSDKATLCHKPGTQAEKTLKVAASAVKAHLKHGDTLHKCGWVPPVDACTYLNKSARDATYSSHGPVKLDFVGDEVVKWEAPATASNPVPRFVVTVAGQDYASSPILCPIGGGIGEELPCDQEKLLFFHDIGNPGDPGNAPVGDANAFVSWATNDSSPVAWTVECAHYQLP